MCPHYSYPISFLWGLMRDGLLQRPRTFADDARLCIARLHPPLRVLGSEHIPRAGCYAITLNHYYRSGFASQWSAFAVSSAIPADVHWVMTGELTFPDQWIAPVGKPVSRFLLGRIARVYGFTTMPPMPPRPRDVQARAAAVRALLRRVEHDPRSIIALAPEGGDQPGGRLTMPPSGAGRFCLLLAAAGLRFMPAGLFEQDGALTLRFGEPYTLHPGREASAPAKDRLAAFTVMSRIAPLLPAELRGEFRAAPPS